MATFVNNLRLKEITPGDEDGTWGGSTNTNLELIADAFGTGTVQLAADANETFTMDDGAADAVRALVIDVTSAVSLTATRTVTLAPNTVNKVWVIKNSTTGGQAIEISQGSGANVTIANGETKAVYGDGAGSGAAIADFLAGLVIGGAFGVEGAVTLESTLGVTGQATLADLVATTVDINGGTVDGVTIGGSSAGAGTFTNLTASGTVSLSGIPSDSLTLTAGAGLTGGGDLSANRTFNVGAGTGITVNANDVALDTSSTRNSDHASISISAGTGLTGGGTIAANRTISLDTGDSRNVSHSSVSITAGTALSGGGTIAASRTINWTGVTLNAVGSAIFGAPLNTSTYAPGSTISGTALSYCDASGKAHEQSPGVILVPGTGTWRCMGRCTGAGLVTTPGAGATTHWVRIS